LVNALARDAPTWLLAGTGLRAGQAFGRYGIEIDGRAPSSPRALRVLATSPRVIGDRSAMTYYETPAGARVFATGAINCTPPWPIPDRPNARQRLVSPDTEGSRAGNGEKSSRAIAAAASLSRRAARNAGCWIPL